MKREQKKRMDKTLERAVELWLNKCREMEKINSPRIFDGYMPPRRETNYFNWFPWKENVIELKLMRYPSGELGIFIADVILGRIQ